MVRSAAAMPSLSHAPWRASSLPKPCRARGHDRFPGLERDAFRAPAARDGRQVRGDRARATRQGQLRRTPSRKSGESSRRSGLPTLRNHRPAAAQGMSSPASKKAIETGTSARRPLLEVLLVFLRLGLTSFGGPVAHLGYFRGEFVERRKWLDEAANGWMKRLTSISSRFVNSSPARRAVRSASPSARCGPVCRGSRRLVWVHHAFGGRDDRFRVWGGRARQHLTRALAARPQDRGRGMPSSRRQIATIIAIRRRSGAKCGSAARARSMNSRAAPYRRGSSSAATSTAGTASGCTG
jgi:hypothetical protein